MNIKTIVTILFSFYIVFLFVIYNIHLQSHYSKLCTSSIPNSNRVQTRLIQVVKEPGSNAARKSSNFNTTSSTKPTTKPLPEKFINDVFKNGTRPKIRFTIKPKTYRVRRGKCYGNCKYNSEVKWKMTIFVKSAAEYFVQRQKTRYSWASIIQVSGAAIDTVFVIGRAKDDVTERRLIHENEQYGDLLQYDGPDDYSNITTKTLAGMQWAGENLPEDSYYSSADDDFLIDMLGVTSTIKILHLRQEHKNWPEFPIICGFKRGNAEEPVRPGGLYEKWAISYDLYRWPTFPAYCHGGLYTTSVRVIKELYKISLYEKLWHLDDVWITGFLRRKWGMPDTMVLSPRCPTGIHIGKNNNISKECEKHDYSPHNLLENKAFCKCR